MADSVSTPPNAEWFFTATDISPFYRLHTVSGGAGQALDVINDNGTSSINLHVTATGQYSGQYWRFDSWPSSEGTDYPYRLSNNFTGLNMHLDVYSDTLQPHLASGDYSGQHWALIPAPSSSSASPTSSSESPTSSSASPITASSAQDGGNGPALSSGAIAGIAVGGVAALALIAGLVIFIVLGYRKRVDNQRSNGGQSRDYHAENTGYMQAESKAEGSPLPAYSPYGHMQNFSGAEPEVNHGQSFPVELPSPERVELPGST